MGQPIHHRGDSLGGVAQRRVWPRDHHNRQAQSAGGSKLGRCPLPARIFGNDMGDTMFLHKRHIARHIKRPFGNNNAAIGQGRCGWRVHQTQQEMMLGQRGKGRKVLLANGQKYAGGGAGQGCNSARNIAHMVPVIPCPRRPRRALQRQQRQPQRPAGCMGIAAHLRSKGVGCVDDVGNGTRPQIISQTLHTAKPAHPHRQWLLRGRISAPRIGKHGIGPRIGQGAGSKAGLSRAPQQQDARHV